MAKANEPYRYVVVESYRESGSGLHGNVHIRPVPAEGFPPGMRVGMLQATEPRLSGRHQVPDQDEADRQGGGRGVPLFLLRVEIRGSAVSR